MPLSHPTFFKQSVSSELSAVEWRIEDKPVAYDEAEKLMKERAAAIAAGDAPEMVWLVEHPALYTAGTSAKREDLLDAAKLPVFESGRGGQFTYHGPGQRVIYIMLDLSSRHKDIRRFVCALEKWIIDTLDDFNIKGEIEDGRVGVWVKRPEKGALAQDKIAAIGVRVSKWVSYHGISLNIHPDLSHYTGIVPCGISDAGVTSFEDLGQLNSMSEVDMALHKNFELRFGATQLS